MLVAKPANAEYGTSTLSRRLDASVLRPEPHTIPTRGARRRGGSSLESASMLDAKRSAIVCADDGTQIL